MTQIHDIDYNVNATEKPDGSIIMTLVNKSLNGVAPITGKPLLILVQVDVITPDINGLPVPTEIKIIGDVGEAIVNAFLKNDDHILAGWFTCKGKVNFLFYTREVKEYKSLLKDTMALFPTYTYSSSTKEDPEWKEYFNMIEQGDIK